MNGKLIVQLSGLALVMGVATVFLIPTAIEPVFWLPIFVFSAYVIARRCPEQRFWNGFVLGLANCFWITAAHILYADQYLARHAAEADMMRSMMPDSPRLMMALFGPAVGIVSGIVIGVLAVIAGKVLKPR